MTEAKDHETLESQVNRLAEFIMAEVPGEPSHSEGAIDAAIRIIASLRDANKALTERVERLELTAGKWVETSGKNYLARITAETKLAKVEAELAEGRADNERLTIAAAIRESEARKVIEPFAAIAPCVEYTDQRDGNVVHRQRVMLDGKHAGWLELTKTDFRRARSFLASKEASHAS